MNKNKKTIKVLLMIFIIGIVISSMILAIERRREMNKKESDVVNKKDPFEGQNITLSNDYNIDIIKLFNISAGKNNYLLSPYNIEIALNMLRDGADGNTKKELDKVLGNRVINNVSVKDKIGIANGVFIKNMYKNDVLEEYYNILKTKYNSELIYDDFYTPDKINNWVKEKTNDMIPKILDNMNPNFVMGLASALAIDVKWLSGFDCSITNSQEFTKINGEKVSVEMMHDSYKYGSYKYLKNDDAIGIILPYQKEENSNVELEFVGILPNKDIDTYINELTNDKLNNLLNSAKTASNDFHVNLSLPRFKYDYNEGNFKEILKYLGIRDAFDTIKANFKKMVKVDVYVGEAIHKTHIELNEIGTKAAAITYFGLDLKAALEEPKYEEVSVVFNKPFMYMIREKNTKEILFFGTVYEPNIWNGTTCTEEN